VDARERLRRYLEQRRELGESEFVLDNMSVEEALKLLGARTGAGGATPPDAPPSRAPERRERSEPAPAPSDWRAVLGGQNAQEEDAMAARKRKAPEPPAAPARAQRAKGDAPEIHGGQESPTAHEPGESTRATPAPASPVADVPAGLSVGGGGEELFGGPLAHLDSLADIAKTVATCTRCPLYATALNPVPGEGNPNADFMVVGEAPGANEDETGRPFVGASGELLTKILAAIKLRREDVFIANVLKHRPPGNRNPTPDEVVACSPYLIRQIELVRPKVILALGTFAAQTLLDTKLGIGKLRGQVHRYHGVPLIVTYHPAALLRNPTWKRPAWEDVQLARRVLDSTGKPSA
jgi:uracil-DNA glycosylase